MRESNKRPQHDIISKEIDPIFSNLDKGSEREEFNQDLDKSHDDSIISFLTNSQLSQFPDPSFEMTPSPKEKGFWKKTKGNYFYLYFTIEKQIRKNNINLDLMELFSEEKEQIPW